ncbi:MAG: hypothetical protein NVSMB9_29220 [Isosphaeraceae bacterium]
MRRALVLMFALGLPLIGGCVGRSYEVRLDKTLADMRYRKRLDDNLMPAPSKGKFNDNLIYLRPPKSLEGPAKEFTLTVLEPGRFDLSESFFEQDKQNLHVLARVKRPKTAAKKGAPAPPPPPSRGDFTADVLAVLSSVYNVDLDSAKAKEESKRTNKFKHLAFEANGKDIQVYLYGSKTTPYEVALIYEYPKTERDNLVSKIELSLGSFEVGERARRAFSGSETVDESTEGSGAPGPVAF